MHKGWFVVLGFVIAQVLLATLIFLTVPDNPAPVDNDPNAEPEMSAPDPSSTPAGELGYFASELLPEGQVPDEGEMICVRICAVLPNSASAAEAGCSAPLPLIATEDSATGETWLVAAAPAATAHAYHPYFAAPERSLLVLDAQNCASQAPVEEALEPAPEEDDEI